MGLATGDVEIDEVEALSATAPNIRQACASRQAFLGILLGASEVLPNLKNSPIDQEWNVLKMMQKENYSTDGHHTAHMSCPSQCLPLTKSWYLKNARWRNWAVLNFHMQSHADAPRISIGHHSLLRNNSLIAYLRNGAFSIKTD
jgi:hypothetical protein